MPFRRVRAAGIYPRLYPLLLGKIRGLGLTPHLRTSGARTAAHERLFRRSVNRRPTNHHPPHRHGTSCPKKPSLVVKEVPHLCTCRVVSLRSNDNRRALPDSFIGSYLESRYIITPHNFGGRAFSKVLKRLSEGPSSSLVYENGSIMESLGRGKPNLKRTLRPILRNPPNGCRS
jgi:hypothetical protein